MKRRTSLSENSKHQHTKRFDGRQQQRTKDSSFFIMMIIILHSFIEPRTTKKAFATSPCFVDLFREKRFWRHRTSFWVTKVRSHVHCRYSTLRKRYCRPEYKRNFRPHIFSHGNRNNGIEGSITEDQSMERCMIIIDSYSKSSYNEKVISPAAFYGDYHQYHSQRGNIIVVTLPCLHRRGLLGQRRHQMLQPKKRATTYGY